MILFSEAKLLCNDIYIRLKSKIKKKPSLLKSGFANNGFANCA